MLTIEGYTIQRLLGEGGMAKVYLATQQSLGRDVAIKVLSHAHDERTKARFFSEARTLATITHPRVLSIFDMGELADGRLFLVMEYIPGGDFRSVLGKPISHRDVLRYLKQIAEGLEVIHQHKIVHRDLKPGNILMRDPGNLVIADFGIAKKMDAEKNITMDGASVGSPSYCSPEQTTEKSLDPRSDLYSLGVVLLEMLTGRNPFLSKSPTETAINHLQMSVPKLPTEHRQFQSLIDGLLAKEPSERYASTADVMIELDRLELLLSSRQKVVKPLSGLFNVRDSKITIVWLVIAVVILAPMLWYAVFFESETDRQIRLYFIEAEASENDGRFRLPAESSAENYYKKVLALDPNNERARASLQALQSKQIGYYLTRASSAQEDKRYFNPERDNAHFYYARVLELDDGNESALKGLAELADVCFQLAKSALEKQAYNDGFEHLRRGLQIQPEHSELLALKSQYKLHSNAVKRFLNRVFK